MGKFVRITIKSLAALFAIMALALVFGAWWLSTKPLDTRDLTPYVEVAFSYLVPQARAHIEKTSVSWDNRKYTLDLSCKKVELVDFKGTRLSTFPAMRLKINIWSFLRGRVLPVEMSVESPRFWLTRHSSGALSLGGEKGKENSSGIEVMPLLQDMADELAHESLQQKIDIKKATIFIHDKLIKKDVVFSIPEISLLHKKGSSKGQAKIELAQKDRPIYVQVSYDFDFKKKQHQAGLSFQDINPASLALKEQGLDALELIDLPLSGKVSVIADRFLKIVDADIKIEGDKGTLISSDMWDAPRTVEKVLIKGGFDKSKNSWVLSHGEIDLGGPKLSFEAEAKAPLAKDELWRHPRQDYAFWARLTVENILMDNFADFWPKTALPNARIWISESMTKGVFTKGEITFRGQMDWDDLPNSSLLSADGSIAAKGADVLYLKGMPAINGVDAKARFDLSKMDIDILGGQSGELTLHPFTIEMSDLSEELQKIVIPVKLSGPTRAVIERIKGPPLGYADQFGLEPEDIGGTMDGTLTLRMPLLADLYLKDVDVEAEAKLTDFSSQEIVPDFEITNGQLDFVLGSDGFLLDGPILLSRLPLALSWKTYFGKDTHVREPLHQATLVGSVEGEAWKDSALIKGFVVDGVTPLTVHYAQTDEGFSTLDAEITLRQAAVRFDDLNWDKPKGEAAKLSFSMEIPKDENIQISHIDFQGDKANVQGTAQLDGKTKKLIGLQFDPFVVGRSDSKVSFSKPTEKGAPIDISVQGKSFDATGLRGGDGKQSPDPRPRNYDLNLETLHTSAEGFLANIKGYAKRDKTGWDEILLKGSAQGQVPVTISLLKEGKIRKFSLLSNDFGLAMKGMGFSDGVSGGKLTITGKSSPKEPRIIRGEMEACAFKVSDVPILARLFSAISPFGFIDLITGDSSFDGMKGRFSWWGDELDLRDFRASGSVVGINLEGRINMDTGAANLNGTVVPFSFVNSIIGSIPLIGDVITGGAGQGVIAAAFKIKGPLAESDISVNPVSLLTPGFLRNLFFSSETKEKLPPKKTSPQK